MSFRRATDAPRREGGFTLIEILVAMGIMAMILAVVLPALSGMLKFGQKQQTHARLLATAAAIKLAYKNNAMLVDATAAPEMQLAAGGSAAIASASSAALLPGSVRDTTAYGATTAAALLQIAQTQGISLSHLDTDGFAKHVAFFVSNRITTQSQGITVYYHVISIVSGEGASSLPAGGTWDPDTGVFTPVASEQVETVSGLPIEMSLLDDTLTTLRNVAAAYGQFFTSRYLSSSIRNVSIDYFSSDCSGDPANGELFDATSPIGNSCNNGPGWGTEGDPYPGALNTSLTNMGDVLWDCQPATILPGFQTTLGFSLSALTSAWGYPVAVCNGPNADGQGFEVRNPSQQTAGLATPPYTAAIDAWAPGGVVVQVPVTGQY